MDGSFLEADEGSGRLSLSLVSYGSDVEDVDLITAVFNQSSDTLVPNSLDDVSHKANIVSAYSSSEEDNLISMVAEQLGLSGVSHEKLDQFSFVLEKMMASQQKFIQSKLLLDAVTNVTKDSAKLSAQTIERVNKVRDHISLLDYVTPPDVDSTCGVFGITRKNLEEYFPNELTAVDIKQLQEAVEEEIALKHEKLSVMNKRYTGILSKISVPVVCSTSNCAEQSDTHELLSLRQELDSKFSTHKAYVEELDKVSSNLSRLKLESFDRVNSSRVDTFDLRCKVLKTQIQSLNNQIVKEIYLEDEHIIDACMELKTNLDVAVTEAKSTLSLLQKKEAEYEKLCGTHFDRLVKHYHDLKKQISQKEYALKSF